MTVYRPRFLRPAFGALCFAFLATLSSCNGSVCLGTDGCFDESSAQTLSVSGTAATGRALASAIIRIDCADGGASTVSDSAGNYSATFVAVLPCAITATATATGAGATLHSLAFAGGTFNATPETELMLVYLASQLGTDVPHLIANLPDSGRYQQALESETNVLAAQAAVVATLQQQYKLTLNAPMFLTTSFAVGQAGVDSDLAALANAGAIDANGMPDAAAVGLLSQAGAAHPL
jgi:hypothetical protein